MRALLLSDTHGLHRSIQLPATPCSLVIHTGDFSNRGSEAETDDFLQWYSELPYRHKLLVAGNHDFFAYYEQEAFATKCHLLGITYLLDSPATINGIHFYGTPWVPRFFDWAFMMEDHDLADIYAEIPVETNVLLTHGPALWALDEVPRGHVGSEALANRISELPNLRYHCFGHIHESNGDITLNGVRYLNNSIMDKWYDARKPRIININ